MKTFTLTKLAGAVALLATAGAAQAYNLPFPTGSFLLSDNSAEYLINCDPTATNCGSTANDDTTVDVGDRLRGIFMIDDISGTGILGGSGYDELAGIFDVTVTSRVDGTDVNGDPQFGYTFGVTAGFAAEYGLSAGAAVAWFTDANHEFIRESTDGTLTIADYENLIDDGTLFWGSGFSGDAFWRAVTATNDIQDIGLGNIGGGQFIFGLNLTDNFSGMTFQPVNCVNRQNVVQVDQCANGNILTPNTQTGYVTPYDVWDDVNFNMYRVPEPGTLALLGLGLLGLGMAKRRRS